MKLISSNLVIGKLYTEEKPNIALAEMLSFGGGAEMGLYMRARARTHTHTHTQTLLVDGLPSWANYACLSLFCICLSFNSHDQNLKYFI